MHWIAPPLLAILLLPAPATAQLLPSAPVRLFDGRVRLGAEITATAGTPDDDTFFNYTDYERNGLRTFRAALIVQWQVARRVAFLTEVRVDDADTITASAAYVRVRPWLDHAFHVQAGRIPPVFGSFGRRAYESNRALIGYPLAYQYLTSLRSDALPAAPEDLLRMRGRGWRSSFPVGSPYAGPGLPLISAFRWDTGVQARWASSRVDAAVALTQGTLSNPLWGDDNGRGQVSGRVAVTPTVGLVLGTSAARGSWVSRVVPGARDSDAQSALGGDAEYSRGHVILRAELVWSRWDLPPLTSAAERSRVSALGAWVEGRYRIAPRWYVAARADRLGFSNLDAPASGIRLPWDAPVRRLELGAGYSIQRNVVVRVGVQLNERDGNRKERQTFFAAQAAWWF